MKKINLQKDSILTKKELASFCGGGAFICSCMNEDGTQTVLPDDASSPEECAEMCRKYWMSRPAEEKRN